ncbi:hydrolase [Salipiger aestuarii]|uniref:HAD superfamily hydrolase (TIGR01509 family) n=1 Tax=Salipiger aestuarii TaxID=568098 RepID=A0A327YEZ8_9RHOB|nr:HAD family hydrolase [Salipiger aestuarii]KAB2542441.1 hydrolase [Salipiger aestuarii]RAK18772.1 HAD superfamily hydrolase (TIGR01509 family) [Salipiger aestuarii]
MRDIRLVILDFDGVVVDSEVISARMLVAELALYGVIIDLPYVARHFLGRSYPVVLRQIRSEFGVSLPEGFEADYRARLIDAFRRDLRLMPGLRTLLARLATPYALATSSSPARVAQSMQIVGISDLFKGRITTAAEVTHGKPAPDLPLRAAQKAGIAPEHCLVIEDSLAGVQAALAAGMQVWRFTGGSHFAGIAPPGDDHTHAHRVFADFAQIAGFAPDLLTPGDQEIRHE